MEFDKKKLPKENLHTLYRVKVETIKPFALMLGPTYLFFKANEKFVLVKEPLEFFTDVELTRLDLHKYFYFPSTVASILPIREAGQRARSLLEMKEIVFDKNIGSAEEDAYPAVILPPSSFELSDRILRTVGPLWFTYPQDGIAVDPFLVTIFVNEVCDLLPAERLIKAREQNSERIDQALFRSSWVVFLALHLGYTDLNVLNDLRLRIFEENMDCLDPPVSILNELDELIEISYQSFENSKMQLLRMDFFSKQNVKISQKLEDRFARIKNSLVNSGSPPAFVFEKWGQEKWGQQKRGLTDG